MSLKQSKGGSWVNSWELLAESRPAVMTALSKVLPRKRRRGGKGFDIDLGGGTDMHQCGSKREGDIKKGDQPCGFTSWVDASTIACVSVGTCSSNTLNTMSVAPAHLTHLIQHQWHHTQPGAA